MRLGIRHQRQAGFTLIELLVALGMFLVITGAAFTLLSSSQQRYQTDSQVLTSFQEARLGMDQIVRDIDDAGFPPPSYSDGVPAHFAGTPFAWSPGYPALPACTVDITCITPANFDLIVETNPDPSRDSACAPTCPVQWIRYQLGGPNGTTLMRGVVNKSPGTDPSTAFTGDYAPAPFVQNVVNNSPSLQIGLFQLSAAYPNVFSSGSVPIFTYVCDTPNNPQPPPALCSAAVGKDNSPANIRDVIITLVVASPLPDATTGKPRLVQLSGRARRVNPSQ